MANWLIRQTVDLNEGLKVFPESSAAPLMYPGDHEGHTWEVRCKRGENVCDMSDGTVAGHFLRADGETVTVVGTVDGNICRVKLTQECYAVEGLLQAGMRWTGTGGDKVTLAAGTFVVRETYNSGEIIDPGDVIPTIDDLLNQMDALRNLNTEAEKITKTWNALYDEVFELDGTEPTARAWTTGGFWSPSTGKYGENAAYIREAAFIYAKKGSFVSVDDFENYRLIVCFYESADANTHNASYSQASSVKAPFVMPIDGYIRISIGNKSNSQTATVDIAEHLITHIITDSRVDIATNKVNGLAKLPETSDVLATFDTYHRSSASYNTSTLLPNWTANLNALCVVIPIYDHGVIRVPIAATRTAGQKYLINADGKVIGNKGSTIAADETWGLTVTDSEYVFDLEKAYSVGARAYYWSFDLTLDEDIYVRAEDYLPMTAFYSSDPGRANESFVMPPAICGVVGMETNVYYENLLLYGSMDTMCGCDISGALSDVERFRDRLIWTPSAAGTTNESIVLYKNDWSGTAKSAGVIFAAAAAGAGASGLRVLIIGDSKIAHGWIAKFLYDKMDESGTPITLLGTRYGNNDSGDTRYRHEGRAGWSTYNYTNSASHGSLANPFYDSSLSTSMKFNFSMYMTNQGYSGVDYVFINLGSNDTSQSTSASIQQTNKIVSSVHEYDPNIKIIVGMNEGAFLDQMEWRDFNDKSLLLNRAKISAYAGRESENIWLLPLYASMDLRNDYIFTDVPLSAADEVRETGKTRRKTNDGLHQHTVGLYKNAMTMYAQIKCIEAGLV